MATHADRFPVPLLSAAFANHYVTTMRPYLLFVSGITGIVGISFHPGMPVLKAALLFVASFLSYGFGQALTDCTQTDTDALSSPYRPMPRGIISARQVAPVSIAGLLFCVAVFTASRLENLALGLVAGIGLATYTPFKRRWWSGPFYNAWIVAVLCGMAFLGSAGDGPVSFPPSFGWAICAVFFGYANFVLSGYFKDVEADRKTGYLTLPVVFGRRAASVASDIFALLLVASAYVSAFLFARAEQSLVPAAAFWSAGTIAGVAGQFRLHRVRADREAHRAIGPVVHSYILTLSSIAVAHDVRLTIPLLAFTAGYLIVLKARPAVDQI